MSAAYPFSIYIGFDSKQPEAYWTCRQSMIEHGTPPQLIFPLVQNALRDFGFYWRDPNEKASTEFTNTRFLVPYLSGYTGRSLFCDSDFLWRCDPMELFLLPAEKNSVDVVKHYLKATDLKPEKMNGKAQSWYPMKNWSSLMVFNNPRCTVLTPDYVNSVTMDQLHQFYWCGEFNIGTIPNTYNSLVGYKGYDHVNPKAVHFTDGGPWLPGYEDVPFAEEWRRVQRAVQ